MRFFCATFEKLVRNLGLSFSVEMCEVAPAAGEAMDVPRERFLGWPWKPRAGLKLLGAPLGDADFAHPLLTSLAEISSRKSASFRTFRPPCFCSGIAPVGANWFTQLDSRVVLQGGFPHPWESGQPSSIIGVGGPTPGESGQPRGTIGGPTPGTPTGC